MRYSLAGTLTLTWPEVADAARTAERLGFDAFYATDHLMGVAGFAPELGVLDALSLALALGPVTERIRLGCIVSPVTMRHPVMLARALQTLDVITGGRAEIGLGAAWNAAEREAAYGRAGRVETSVMLSVRLTSAAAEPGPGAFAGPAEAVAGYLAGFAEAGVQRIVLSTPRPWHPDKLEALAAVAGLCALHRGVGIRGSPLPVLPCRFSLAGSPLPVPIRRQATGGWGIRSIVI